VLNNPFIDLCIQGSEEDGSLNFLLRKMPMQRAIIPDRINIAPNFWVGVILKIIPFGLTAFLCYLSLFLIFFFFIRTYSSLPANVMVITHVGVISCAFKIFLRIPGYR
jgi:hypothetical protein